MRTEHDVKRLQERYEYFKQAYETLLGVLTMRRRLPHCDLEHAALIAYDHMQDALSELSMIVDDLRPQGVKRPMEDELDELPYLVNLAD